MGAAGVGRKIGGCPFDASPFPFGDPSFFLGIGNASVDIEDIRDMVLLAIMDGDLLREGPPSVEDDDVVILFLQIMEGPEGQVVYGAKP